MKKISYTLFLGLLLTQTANASTVFTGAGESDGRSYIEARDNSLKLARLNAFEQAEASCFEQERTHAQLCGSFQENVTVERIMTGRWYEAKATSTASFQCGEERCAD
jgi:hypothetical protein